MAQKFTVQDGNLTFDPTTGVVELFQAGAEVARTLTAAAGGWEVNNTLTGAGFERVLTASDVFTANTPLNLIGDINTATPPTTEAITSLLQFRDLADDDSIVRIGYDGENILRIENLMGQNGATSIALAVTNGSNVTRDIFTARGDTAGKIQFFASSLTLFGGSTFGNVAVSSNDAFLAWQAQRRIASTQTGMAVEGDLSNDPTTGGVQDTHIALQNDFGNAVGDIDWQSTTDLSIINRVHAGSIILIAEDTAGTERTILTGDPDAITTLTGDTELRFDVAAVEASRIQAATVQTTDATVTEILAVAVASGESKGFEIHVIGREDATGDSVFVRVFVAISNQAGTTSFVGGLTTDRTDVAGSSTWAITVAADDTTDELTVDVTGEAAHTIDWKIRLNEINV